MKRKNLTTIEYAKVLDLLLGENEGRDRALDVFLYFLKSRESLYLLESIIKEFVLLSDEKEGKTHIVVTTNSDLEDTSTLLIQKALNASLVEKKIDKSIIGGMRIETGSIFYDITVNSQIKKLRQILSKE